jgi:hypothetical protein
MKYMYSMFLETKLVLKVVTSINQRISAFMFVLSEFQLGYRINLDVCLEFCSLHCLKDNNTSFPGQTKKVIIYQALRLHVVWADSSQDIQATDWAGQLPFFRVVGLCNPIAGCTAQKSFCPHLF